jgi:hypothetical protein
MRAHTKDALSALKKEKFHILNYSKKQTVEVGAETFNDRDLLSAVAGGEENLFAGALKYSPICIDLVKE